MNFIKKTFIFLEDIFLRQKAITEININFDDIKNDIPEIIEYLFPIFLGLIWVDIFLERKRFGKWKIYISMYLFKLQILRFFSFSTSLYINPVYERFAYFNEKILDNKYQHIIGNKYLYSKNKLTITEILDESFEKD